jgi:glycosyltransferase involved in cell wall biosynthesis
MKYSIVIPAYNEEESIGPLYARLLPVLDGLEESWELIFVNDGSRDRTLEQLQGLASKDPRVKYLDLSRNFGHQAALSAGLEHASGLAVISMDCDLQDPPELLAQMIQKWKAGADIVYARRLNYRSDNWLKSRGSKLYYRMLDRFSDVSIPRNVGDFRLVDRRVLEAVNGMAETSRYLRGMVAWTGYKHDFVDYQRPDREHGTSEYSLWKLIKLGMSGLFSFSFLPLQFGFVLGILSILFGFAFLAYMSWDVFIEGAKYEFFKFLVVVMFIFLGFLFMLMWLLGEYIGRIYNEVRKRPIYLVKEKVNFDDDHE